MKLLQSPYFFRPLTPRFKPHHPYPQAFCTLPSFAHIKKPRWRPIGLNDRHLRCHGKIGDCEQSLFLQAEMFFFQSLSSSLRSQSLHHFVWEALGFSLFVATRFLYVKLLGFFGFWKALVKDSTSAVSTLSIFSLNLILIFFNVALNNHIESKWATFTMIFV